MESVRIDSAFGDMIRQTMHEAGLRPVEFERPLKSISAQVVFKKRIEPENVSVRHSAVGWCFGTILDQFTKDLFNIKNLIFHNDSESVRVEVLTNMMAVTFEEDHVAWFDGLLECMAGDDYPAHGCVFQQRYWHWDSVERISDIVVFVQQRGDGHQTKLTQETE